MPIIGQSSRRVDALSKVTGQAQFPGDINFPGQLVMKVLFANRPHAIVRGIDTSQVEELPGVIAVFTSRDVPVNEYGLIMPDQPVLCGPGSSKPYADRVRFVGDQVALVVAENEQIANQARDLIKVTYDDLPNVTNPLVAMRPEAVKLHPERGSNIFCHYKIRKGSIDEGFAQAEVVIEGEYRTPSQEHAYLQPEAGLGYIDDAGRVTVEVAGQWTHEDQKQIAHALDLPIEQVRVIYPAIGGAFGGREDMSIQIILALAAWRLHQRGINKPVKIIWSREESIIGHHKRHPYVIKARWGATRQGRLIAAQMEVIQDGGAYAYTSTKVLGNTTLLITGPYDFPNVSVDSYAVYTNNIPGGAFRGFGGPQAAYVAETQMNRLAEALGLDPVEVRLRNVLRGDAHLSVGSPLPPGANIDQVIEQCALSAGWQHNSLGWSAPETKSEESISPGRKTTSLFAIPPAKKPSLKRGVGFACAFKNVGFSFGFPENCWTTVELHGKTDIERVLVFCAGADVGQGAHTVMAQLAAEAVGVSLEKVELVVSDTAYTDNSGSASASRMTFMAGNAIQGAVTLALEKWRGEERPAIGRYQYRAPSTTPFDPETGKSVPNFAYGYAAQAVLVELDTETGNIRVLRVISADDVGKAINPQMIEGQVEGAITQAIGFALLENFVQKDGIVLTNRFSTYLIPGIFDVPDQVNTVILEYPDPRGPWGARGVGEMPFMPFTPAIVAAVHQATEVWFEELPLTPEKVLRKLGKI